MGQFPDPPILLAQALVLFLGIGIHEYAHCKFADMAGDPTPSFYGRVTLNLTKHFEPIGTMMMAITLFAGFGLGWGRPAPMNPSKMRNPRWDLFAAVAAGPVSNLIQAVIFALILRISSTTGMFASLPPGFVSEFIAALLIFGVAINLGLFCFNLIPFGPLDGHYLVGLLLPEPQRVSWFRFNRQIGMMGLFVFIIFLQVSGISLTSGPVSFLFKLLTGLKI